MATGGRSAIREESLLSKLSSAISKQFKKWSGAYDGQIRCGRTAVDMPALHLAALQKSVMASSTGPSGGLCQLDPEKDSPTHDRDIPVAGITHWYRPQPQADGVSITLYEHKAGSQQHHGDPIADVYAVVARPNSGIVAVADGVNWGIKPRLAARCAVHGCMDHLNNKLFDSHKMPPTTQDIFHNILRSFHSAQTMIIQKGGTTTTLCVAIVVELQDPKAAGSRWGLCVVSVGDSLCFVWKSETQEVFEVTSEMHVGKDRNPRDCGGCLGCDLGDRPDLSNLICCFVPLADDDIVFVTSDGIADNLDPVILKTATSISQQTTPTTPSIPFPSTLTHDFDITVNDRSPVHQPQAETAQLHIVDPAERQHLLLVNLRKLLRDKCESVNRKLNATDVKEALITHVIEVTDEKRQYLEQCWNEMDKPDLTSSQKRANDRKISQYIKQLPGKLDHATVAAYCVGKIVLTQGDPTQRTTRTPTNSFAMNNVLQSSTAEAPRQAKSVSAGGSVFYTFSSQPSRDGGNSSSSSPQAVVGGANHGHTPTVISEDNDGGSECDWERVPSLKPLWNVRVQGGQPTVWRSDQCPVAGQEALVSFPVCLDNVSEPYECIH